MTIETDAPQTSDAAPVSEAPAETPSENQSDDLFSTVERAFSAVEKAESSRANETSKAAAVLKDGPEAEAALEASDQKRVDDAKAAADKAIKEASTPQKEAQPKDEKGRFKAKDAEPPADDLKETEKAETPTPPKHAAPDRFSQAGKDAWAEAPEAVQAEVNRAVAELQNGLEKYRKDAEGFGELREHQEAADKAGISLRQLMDNYADFDRLLLSGPEGALQAMDRAARAAGYTLEQIAEHVVQTPKETREQSKLISDMQQEISTLKREVERRDRTAAERQHASIKTQIETFAKDHPRFQELEPEIAKIINGGLIERTGNTLTDLTAAYEKAERLNPLPTVSPPPQETVPAPQQSAQTRKADISISGAPGSGSNPGSDGPASQTPEDSVRRAFAAVGL